MFNINKHRWKIKPKRWGPPSLVRQTIYNNLEKIYHINSRNAAIIFPMWECGGNVIYDYSKYGTNGTASGDVSWYGNYINIGADVDRITSSFLNVSASTGTIILGFIPDWNDGDARNHVLFDTYGGNNKRIVFYESGASNLNLYTNTISRGSTTYSWVANTKYNIAITWPTNILYINGSQHYNYSDGNLGNSASTLYIGDAYTASDFGSDGKFMYLYIFNEALTSSQIALFDDRPYGILEK